MRAIDDTKIFRRRRLSRDDGDRGTFKDRLAKELKKFEDIVWIKREIGNVGMKKTHRLDIILASCKRVFLIIMVTFNFLVI